MYAWQIYKYNSEPSQVHAVPFPTTGILVCVYNIKRPQLLGNSEKKTVRMLPLLSAWKVASHSYGIPRTEQKQCVYEYT